MFKIYKNDKDVPEYADHPMHQKYFAGKTRVLLMSYEDIKIKIVVSYPHTYVVVAGVTYPMPKLLDTVTEIDPSFSKYTEIAHAIDNKLGNKINKTWDALDTIWQEE
jgi:hypothetical protein